MEDSPLVCKTRDQAIRTAERLAKRKAGVIAFHRAANEFDEFGAPEFLAVHGSVPSYIEDNLPFDLASVVTSENPVADGPINAVDLKFKGWVELL